MFSNTKGTKNIYVFFVIFSFLIPTFAMLGCSSTPETKPNEYELFLDITSDKNAIFNKYAITVSLDGEEIGTVDNGEEFTYLTTVLQGNHTLEFSKEGKDKPNTSKEITISEDTSYSCLLKHDGFSIKINNESIDSYISETVESTNISESSSETIMEIEEPTTSETESRITTKSSESDVTVAVSSETTETSETTEITETSESTGPTAVSENITSLSFASTKDVKLFDNGKAFTGTIKATVIDRNNFSADDIILGSGNPDVATIKCTGISYPGTIYYSIEPVSIGKTYVYAKTTDGNVYTNLVNVYVSEYIETDSIWVEESRTIGKGDFVELDYGIGPENASDKNITWTSSDSSIVSVTQTGYVRGVGYGSAEITATTADGCSATCEVTVSLSQAQMKLKYKKSGNLGTNIGHEWSFSASIDDERVKDKGGGTYTFDVDETIVFYCYAYEADNSPDEGDNTVYYTVTEEDLMNGFTVEVEVYVTEDRGKNAGEQAYFIFTFEFTPV